MNNNLFARLAAGDSFLENAYSQENLEKQAKQLAQQQIKAVQGVAHQQLAQAIGESGVEAAVGAAGIAYPFVKKYGPQFVDSLPSLTSMSGVQDSVVSGLRNSARQIGERIAGRAGPTGRPPAPFTTEEIVNPLFDPRAADVLPPEPDEPAQSFRPEVISQAERDRLFSQYNQDFDQHIRDTGGQVARLQENIRNVPTAENVSPLVQGGRQPEPTFLRSDVERELGEKRRLLNQDRGAFAREEAGEAGVSPLDITEDRLARLEAQDPDVPTVSVPPGERAARIAARRAARPEPIQEPELTEPKIMDPFRVGVEAEAPKDWADIAAENFPKATEDFDPYQDVIDADRMRQEREAMTRDRERYARADKPEPTTDYDPIQPTEKAHLRSIKPVEPEPEAATGTVAPLVPPSELTGGISPASLPEGAGFSRGGLKITAKREPAPPPEPQERPVIQQRGLQEQAFEQDPEEDIRTGQQFEPESFSPEELFKPITIDVPDEEPAAKLAAPEEEEAPLAAPQEKPELEEIEKGETPKIPEAEIPKPDIVSEGKGLLKGIGESVAKELPEETGALELPAIGEVALAAVGVGQLIAGLVDKHKEQKEEASQAAQMMQQKIPSVALDAAPTFDSTFR